MHGHTRSRRSTDQSCPSHGENGNTKWADAIKLELQESQLYSCFRALSREEMAPDEYQFVPMHMVFAVKHDLRHKARLVIGGHVTTADELDKYTATTSLAGVTTITPDCKIWEEDDIR